MVYGSFCNATCFASTSITNIRFDHLIRPKLERIGEGTLECWYSLTPACISVCSCFIALGASANRNDFIIVPTIRPLLPDESTTVSMAYLATNACQETPTAVASTCLSRRRVQAGRSTPRMAYLAINAARGLDAAFYACYRSPYFIIYGALARRRTSSSQQKHRFSQVPIISICPRLTPDTTMAAITDLGESNQLAATLPGSHSKIFKVSPIVTKQHASLADAGPVTLPKAPRAAKASHCRRSSGRGGPAGPTPASDREG
eukprot:6199930-Pleurochrysis_carterae.AAC.1